MWPDVGLQRDQQGSGRELRSLGRQGRAGGHSLAGAPGPAPRGCSQALVCLPALSSSTPRLPAFWMAVAQGVGSVVLPSLTPIPLGTTGHIWSAENYFIERFWTGSKRPEQLSHAESNLGSKEELPGHDLF